jgi:hypothetical protein
MPEPTLVDVGWRNCSAQAALAYFPPEPIGGAEQELARHLFPAHGPANDLSHRIVQVRCPYDLTIRTSPRGIWPAHFSRVPEEGGLSQVGFDALVTPIAPEALRNSAIPAVEISLNLMIVTDETCTLHLMPPFLSDTFRDWPGSIVSGRFPVRSWPRPLNCVLEWQDHDRDWVLRRGDPMIYLMFDFDDPAKRPRMVEAALTAPLERHFAQVENVTSFGRNVGPMFREAERRRPARLLKRKRTGCPEFL